MSDHTPPLSPYVAHHQHLISPAFGQIVQHEPFDSTSLLSMLDAAGTMQAVVLSMAYSFADERKKLANPEALVRAENDWTAAQVARSPARIRGFCSVNPLTPHALDEIKRCSGLPGMRGLKLHFANSGVSLRNPVHADRMREVFGLSDKLRIPIAVHLRSRSGSVYGAEDAKLFIQVLLPLAPNITVQIAHLAGAGPGHPADADASLVEFVRAIARRDGRTKKLIFDVTTVASLSADKDESALVAKRLRQIGLRRIVFGSDMAIGSNPPLLESWQIFRRMVPLTPAEFNRIARNTAPYL